MPGPKNIEQPNKSESSENNQESRKRNDVAAQIAAQIRQRRPNDDSSTQIEVLQEQAQAENEAIDKVITNSISAGYDELDEKWKKNKDVIRALIKKGLPCLDYVPEDYRDKGVCLLAVEENPDNFRYVPNGLQEDEEIRRATAINGGLEFTPEFQDNKQVVLESIRKQAEKEVGFSWAHRALKNASSGLRDDPEVLLAALEARRGHTNSLGFILEAASEEMTKKVKEKL